MGAITIKNKTFLSAKGFTLVELAVVIGILATLLGIVTINLLHAQNNTSLSTSLDVLLSDIREQQMKAMIGDTGGRSSGSAYGIHFSGNQYMLFHGTTYTTADTTIKIEGPIIFTNVLFPNANLIFSKASGEITGFSSSTNAVTMRNTADNREKTIHFNRYGVVTSID